MKKSHLPIIILLLASLPGWAQMGETIRVKTGEKLPTREKYLYPEFSSGTVFYRDGRPPGSARLNFNLLEREMQFLTPTGDTLALAEEQTIRQIKLRDEAYMYDQNGNILTLLGSYGDVTLAVDHSLKIANVDKEGGYGISSGASSIRTYNSYPTGTGSTAKLEQKGDVVFSHQRVLMLINKNNLAFPASRKSVLKMYPKQKSAIEDYLREHSVQFNDAEDLKKLLEHSERLK